VDRLTNRTGIQDYPQIDRNRVTGPICGAILDIVVLDLESMEDSW